MPPSCSSHRSIAASRRRTDASFVKADHDVHVLMTQARALRRAAHVRTLSRHPVPSTWSTSRTTGCRDTSRSRSARPRRVAP
jgi:phosphopantothenoylcysteine synthetase/decarboxylase